jgi:hypothetical protein
MRKAYVELKVKIIMELEEGVSVNEVINDMDYKFSYSEPNYGEITDTEILDYEVVDSK